MIQFLIVILIIFIAFCSATREAIDLDRADLNSWLYTWDWHFWNADAFHTWPFLETIGHGLTPLAILSIPGSHWWYIPLYFFIFYQWRNGFLHQWLPLNIKDSLDPLQLVGLLQSVILMVLYLIY